jgi:hypothetical protein
LKNASRNEIPNWLTTFRDSVGSTDYNNNSNDSNTDDEELKQVVVTAIILQCPTG